MNNALSFVVGVTVGAVASYFIFKKKFQQDADNQIAEVKAKMSELKESNDILKVARQNADINYNKSFDAIAKPVAEEPAGEVDYNAISTKKKVKVVKESQSQDVHKITDTEYYNLVDKKKYDEKVFTFYMGDHQLVDDETELAVVDPEEFLGPNGVDAIRDVSSEEVYFVDDDKKSVYTIMISEDSYDDPSLVDDPRE